VTRAISPPVGPHRTFATGTESARAHGLCLAFSEREIALWDLFGSEPARLWRLLAAAGGTFQAMPASFHYGDDDLVAEIRRGLRQGYRHISVAWNPPATQYARTRMASGGRPARASGSMSIGVVRHPASARWRPASVG